MSEILIIAILITIWLFIVRNSIDHAKKTNENVKQSVIANQIATEWAELVYQLRNTNILEYYYNHNLLQTQQNFNQCRLAYDYARCVNEFSCYSNYNDCSTIDNLIIRGWSYYIDKQWNFINCKCTGDPYCDNIKNKKYAICLNDWVRVPCPEWHEAWNDQSRYWKFYRRIEGIWIYDMSENNTPGWKEILSDFCSAWNTQEYRFCSMVARKGWENCVIEICSTMTNFIE